jgi:hypothetical protein
MTQTGIAISGLAETNTNWANNHTKQSIQRQSKRFFSNSSIVFSNNRFQPTNLPSHAPSKNVSNYQPGGCLQVCHSHWSGRVKGIISDKKNMGRWTGQNYRWKENCSLSVITAYCPCNQTYSAIENSTLTVNKQQVLLQLEDTGTIQIPWKVFMDDLITLIQDLDQDPLMTIALLIYANASIDEKASPLFSLLSNTSLIDTFQQFTGVPCTILTYTRGSKRIDDVFSSQSLLPLITKVGYLSFYEASESDHRGAFIDIDDSLLDQKVELQRPPI